MKSDKINLNKELFVGKVSGAITDHYQILKVKTLLFIL